MKPRVIGGVALVAGLAWTATAYAHPSGPNSTFPSHIRLMGQNGNGEGDPLGAFTVVVRDASNNPVPGARVMLDLYACGELVLCQQGRFCLRSVTGLTNPTGAVTLVARGFRGPGATATPFCATLSADGVPLGTPRISAFDMDGVNGVNPLDVSSCYADVVSGTYFLRSDHDGDGDVDPLDVSISASIVFGYGSTNSCPPCVSEW